MLRRLDRVPFAWTSAAGVLFGLAAGATVLGRAEGGWLAVPLVVMALAVALAWSAQPVGIWETVEEVEPLLDMMAIEGGSFWMGSPEDEPGRFDNEIRHQVTVSDFYIGRTAVTNEQYREVMELEDSPGPGGDEHPVTGVSWFDAVAFCNRLSEREALTPCYKVDGHDVRWLEDAGGYRLPTEAEWEYAARAGTTSRWSFGDEEGQLGSYAWFVENSDFQAHPVATRGANPWSLFDMHGNAWEWCWDGYAEYSDRPEEDPRGPEAPGASRVLRGGAFNFEPWFLRSAVRRGDSPGISYEDLGFRCIRRARRQP